MCDRTYNIIDWKSCESYSPSDSSTDDKKDLSDPQGTYPRSKDDLASTIVFPKLFHERESETSIVTMPDEDAEIHNGLSQFYTDWNTVEMEEQSVYHKVANWVLTQRKYFSKIEPPIEDDEMEVIDPVDLFHESILNDYLLITENESERRTLLRDFHAHRYHIEAVDDAMKTNEYRFLRKPKEHIEMELIKIIDFHKFHHPVNPKRIRKRRDSSSTNGYPLSCSSQSSSPEKTEEQLDFLGVPRLLENYTILNREGYIIKEDGETDLWLSPLEEGYVVEGQDKQEGEQVDLDFMSSWFSDVYQTDINTDEVRTLITVNTDLLEKATVISVSNASEEEVWVDAPDIPHWFDDEQEDLELFNQPSRPLYYYRDRIKGCYRIIGVEDETVVLFSGNDDDTIFYPGDEVQDRSNSSSDSETRPSRLIRSDSDRKNDSGIEDVDDIIYEDVTVASISISKDSVTKLRHVPSHRKTLKRVEVNQRAKKPLSQISVILAAIVVVLFAIFVSGMTVKEIVTSGAATKVNELFSNISTKLNNLTL